MECCELTFNEALAIQPQMQPCAAPLNQRDFLSIAPHLQLQQQQMMMPALNHREVLDLELPQKDLLLDHREVLDLERSLDHREVLDLDDRVPQRPPQLPDYFACSNECYVPLQDRQGMSLDEDALIESAEEVDFEPASQSNPYEAEMVDTASEPAAQVSNTEKLMCDMDAEQDAYVVAQQKLLESSFQPSLPLSAIAGDDQRGSCEDLHSLPADVNCACIAYATAPAKVPTTSTDKGNLISKIEARRRAKRSVEDRNIRIFFSSTFKDMQEERELVAKKVMPEIRAQCALRGVTVNQVDLRWGITKEQSESGNTISICLSEVDRCRPWFISMLGERYGWCHSENEKDELLTKTFANAVAKFPWIMKYTDRSITELEIRHAVLNASQRERHALFFLRDPHYVHKGYDSSDFAECPGSAAAAKLLRLKGEIRCHGNTAVDYGTPGDFVNLVQQQMLSLLNEDFPKSVAPSPLARERLAHDAFARSRGNIYVGGENYVFQLNCFIATQQNLPHPQPIVVLGDSGMGKSSLLSHYARRFEEEHRDIFVLEHYIGCSGLSTDLGKMITRIINEIIDFFELQDRVVPADLPGLKEALPEYFLEASRRGGMLLITDALNQLEDRDAEELQWFPARLPPNVQVVASCLPEGVSAQAVQTRGWRTLLIHPLDENSCCQIISECMKECSKSLSYSQMERIVNTPQVVNPLFLRTFVDEIKVHGKFETLDLRIAQCSHARDIPELFGLVLARIEGDLQRAVSSSVGPCLVLTYLARRGLTEGEMMGILGLSQVAWSELAIALADLLDSKSGFLNFTHDYVRQAVVTRYVTPATTTLHRKKLISYFRDMSVCARSCEELPFHLQQGAYFDELAACITNTTIFFMLVEEEKFDLYRYFRACSTQPTPAQRLVQRVRETCQGDFKKLHTAGKFLQDMAFYVEAEALLKESLAVTLLNFPATHPEVANSKDALGYLYRLQARFEKACPLYEDALQTRRREFGEESQEAAASMCNLAILYRKTGKYDKAEPLYVGSCAIRKKVLGIYYPETGMSENGLGCLYQDQGKDKQAEEHFLTALNIRERCNGPNHPDVAMTLTNLASLYLAKARYDESERLFTRALNIYENVFGENHPDVAHTLAYLAGVYVEKGRYLAAKPLFERAIAIKTTLLGQKHPEVAQSLSDFGVLYSRMRDYDSALSLYRQCLAIREEVLGMEHPDTAQSMNNVGAVLASKGDFTEAERMYLQALHITEAKFGKNHQNVCQSLLKLASLYQRQHRPASDIEPLYRRALDILRQQYGEVHPDYALCLNDLAVLKFNSGRAAEAEALYLQMLRVYEQLFPPREDQQMHPDLARAHKNVAAFYAAVGNVAEAQRHSTLAATA
eukprot:TRINITY_DN450_c0_g1_i3.p1 TRINITY_DN450_c0_g1~~TRINITY_DN450_c0_g1_i3.p1  ORF type:complete len:1376 (-),score=324.64 TRINITY_DN450_c0_g1_i3:50-4144(-)